jgi:hypothetical protein
VNGKKCIQNFGWKYLWKRLLQRRIIKMDVKLIGYKVWTGFRWLRLRLFE